MTVSFIEQTIAGQLSYKAGEIAGSMISRTPLPDYPFKTKKAPTPSGFKQTPLPTYTRQFTEEPSRTDVQPVGEGGEGQTVTKYSISG